MVPDHMAIDDSFEDDLDAGISDLQRSINQLGPRTSVHGGTANGGGTAPAFDEWVALWFAGVIPGAMEKAQQYGSNSLAKKGHRFAAAQGRAVPQAQALELGVAQYAVEKSDRVEDAILRGHLPSTDTWTDIAIYALMAQYVRQHGTW